MRWALGGWTFFLAENLLLSHHRTEIISLFGGDEAKYHLLYGSLSTAACASIGYGYVRHARHAPPFLWPAHLPAHPVRMMLGFAMQAVGFAGLAQALPELQTPVVGGPDGRAGGFVVRCPFNLLDKRGDAADGEVRGAIRVTRHPGFWAFGLSCLGGAATVPSLPQAAWLSMPAVVALIGGAHADYRHRRGLGGSLPPETEAVTSLVPFVAMLSGAQGNVAAAFSALFSEIKASNAAAGVAFAAIRALRLAR